MGCDYLTFFLAICSGVYVGVPGSTQVCGFQLVFSVYIIRNCFLLIVFDFFLFWKLVFRATRRLKSFFHMLLLEVSYIDQQIQAIFGGSINVEDSSTSFFLM